MVFSGPSWRSITQDCACTVQCVVLSLHYNSTCTCREGSSGTGILLYLRSFSHRHLPVCTQWVVGTTMGLPCTKTSPPNHSEKGTASSYYCMHTQQLTLYNLIHDTMQSLKTESGCLQFWALLAEGAHSSSSSSMDMVHVDTGTT